MSIKATSFIALETTLTERLAEALRKATAGHYGKIGKALKQGDFSEARSLVEAMSIDLRESTKEVVSYITKMSMLFGASRVTPDPGTSVVGMGFEADTMEQAATTFGYMLGEPMTTALTTAAVQLIALAEGAPVQKAEEPERIIRDFSSFMDKSGKSYLNLVSSLHTSRVSAYGFCAEATAMGMETYQINEQLDIRTCTVCRHMHGKTFKVRDAKELLNVALRAKNPEDLRHIQPWPKQDKASMESFLKLSDDELVASRWHLPPFHPGCRGLLGRSGKVPSLTQIAQGNTEKPYEATAEDFKAMGLKASPAQLKKWNSFAKMPPAEMVSRIRGVSLTDFLAGLVGLKTQEEILEYTGITSFKIGDTVAMKLFSKLYGMKENAEHAITLSSGTKRLLITELEADGPLPSKSALGYVRGAVSVARDMGLNTVAVGSGTVLDEVTSIVAGFLPAQTMWNTLRIKVLKDFKGSPLWGKMTKTEQGEVEDILGSTDPKGLRKLITMPEGAFMLTGYRWVAYLDLTDAESMTMFLKAAGASLKK